MSVVSVSVAGPSRPISPFELSDGRNHLQGQLDSIVRRLAENEQVVRSIGELLSVERLRHLNGVESRTEVALGEDEHGRQSVSRRKKQKELVSSKASPSSSTADVPVWCQHKQTSAEIISSAQHSRTPTPLAKSKAPVKQSKDVMRLLRALAQRSHEVHHIRQELQRSQRHATANAKHADDYRQQHKDSELRLAHLSQECDRLRSELVKTVHDTTEVDVAVMVADLQSSIVELQSDVVALAEKATAAEGESVAKEKESERLREALNGKEQEVLRQRKSLEHQSKEIDTVQHQLKKALKGQKTAVHDADVWQQKFLSLGRELRRKETTINQQQAAINCLQDRVRDLNVTADENRKHVAEMERERSVEKEQAKLHPSQLEDARKHSQTLESELGRRCKRQVSECEEERLILESNLRDLSERLDRDSARQSQEQDHVSSLDGELRAARSLLETLQSENRKISAEKSQICDEVNQTVEQMAAEHGKWQGEAAVLKEKLASAEATAEELRSANQALRDQSRSTPLLDVTFDAEVLKKELKMKAEEQSLRQKLAEVLGQLEQKTADHRHAVATLQGMMVSNHDLRSALDALKAENSWKSKQLDELESTRKSMQEELMNCQLQLQSLMSDLKLTQAQLKSQAKEEIFGLKESLQSRQHQLEKVEARAAKLRDELKECRASDTSAKQERVAAQALLAKLEAECGELRASLADKQSRLRQERDEHLQHSRQLRQSLQSAKQKTDSVERNLAETSEQMANVEKRLKQRSAQVSSLQEQLKAASKQLSSDRDDKVAEMETLAKEKEVLAEKLAVASSNERTTLKRLSQVSSTCKRLETVLQDSTHRLRQMLELTSSDQRHVDIANDIQSAITDVDHAYSEQQKKLKHQLHALSKAKPSLEPCVGCITRMPQLLAKLEKARKQAADAKQMLQASRRMLEKLAASSTQQEAVLTKQITRLEEETRTQHAVVVALKHRISGQQQ